MATDPPNLTGSPGKSHWCFHFLSSPQSPALHTVDQTWSPQLASSPHHSPESCPQSLTSAPLVMHGPTKTSFLSLPRELRDQVLEQLLISPQTIFYSNVVGPVLSDPDLLTAMPILFDWGSSRQIGVEACQTFYQRNTFEVHSEDLPFFLGSAIHKTLQIGPSSNPRASCIRSFEIKAWVTKLEVVIEKDNVTYSRYLAHELAYLLQCPQLRLLIVKTGRTTALSWKTEWKGMMKELKKKLGTGLTVTCEKPAGGFNAVSLEWEESEGLSEDQEDRATF